MNTDWLDSFDEQDVLNFQAEISACKSAADIRAVVHEWQESALAAALLDLVKQIPAPPKDRADWVPFSFAAMCKVLYPSPPNL